jgi:hypothetical protein
MKLAASPSNTMPSIKGIEQQSGVQSPGDVCWFPGMVENAFV